MPMAARQRRKQATIGGLLEIGQFRALRPNIPFRRRVHEAHCSGCPQG
jgi:hypothetical protein